MANPFTTTLYNTPMVDPKTGLLGPEWQKYFNSQSQTIASGPVRIATQTPATANASIGVTPIDVTGSLPAGVYRVTAYAKVIAVASVSSDLSADAFWVDKAASCSKTLFTGMNGNTTTTTAGGTFTFRSDGGAAPITFSTTYSSTAANEMQYDLIILLESLV